MGCSVKTATINVPAREAQISAAAASRKIVCNNCEWRKGDTCKIIEAKNGSARRASIADGIRRLSARCPKGNWEAVTTECVKCGRSIVTDDFTHQCKWCDIKDNIGRRHRVPYQPRVINHNLTPKPFDGTPIRNLHYFLYPRYEESVDYHLSQLKKCRRSFNGKKICCVAIDLHTHHDKYDSQLQEYFDYVYYIQNDPARRESAGFVTTLERMKSKKQNEIICFAHGKGQQSHTKESRNVRLWNDAMYETVCANWRDAMEALAAGYSLAGSFKSIGNFSTTAHRWHYSGSFFWARSQDLFSNKAWKQMCNQWWAAESYVGRHFASNEAYCLFGDHISGGAMYKDETWKRLTPELEEWRIQHERIRRAFTD